MSYPLFVVLAYTCPSHSRYLAHSFMRFPVAYFKFWSGSSLPHHLLPVFFPSSQVIYSSHTDISPLLSVYNFIPRRPSSGSSTHSLFVYSRWFDILSPSPSFATSHHLHKSTPSPPLDIAPLPFPSLSVSGSIYTSIFVPQSLHMFQPILSLLTCAGSTSFLHR